ncbi:MAG TPA: hypothetical protein VF876_00210 [Burkholderiales bacterium]
MRRAISKGTSDSASLGAEALPSGYAEISKAMQGQPGAAPVGGVIDKAGAPLLGLIALAAHWVKQRGGSD